jgi:diguanylate cyclase (GGDEF)-like protein
VSPRRSRSPRPALLRSRLRLPFFAALTIVCLAAGQLPSAVVAGAGIVLALLSLQVARLRDDDFSLTFVALDWLALGLVVALGGGTASLLVLSVPALAFVHLAVSARSTWPYVLAPSLLLIVVLAIADPTLGGHRLLRTAELITLVGGGAAGAAQLRRPPRRRQVTSVDEATGFYSGRRLSELLERCVADAAADHEPLSVVYLRIEHFKDCRDFMGAGSDALLAAVARRLHRELRGDDLAFRAADDTFVIALRERDLAGARSIAAAIAHEVGAHPIEGHRLSLIWGAATYPAVRDARALVREARDAALRPPQELELALAQ